MSAAKISRILQRRPPQGRFREQLFWLVDLVYACKSSEEPALVAQAQVVEEALGSLGEYLETGNLEALAAATSSVEQFAQMVKRHAARGDAAADAEPPAPSDADTQSEK